jgi:hypothetical protein
MDEGGRRGVARCRDWAEACHVLVDVVCGSTVPAVGVNSSPGMCRGSTYTSSATDACRSSLKAVRMARRTIGSASVQCGLAWHMIAALSVR